MLLYGRDRLEKHTFCGNLQETIHRNGIYINFERMPVVGKFFDGELSPDAEVDFLLQIDGKVVPIEVKYDTNVHARSLKHFVSMYHPDRVIRLSARNFGTDGKLLSVPLYVAFCI